MARITYRLRDFGLPTDKKEPTYTGLQDTYIFQEPA